MATRRRTATKPPVEEIDEELDEIEETPAPKPARARRSRTAAKPKPAPVEDESEEDDEEEEAPKPVRRRAAPKRKPKVVEPEEDDEDDEDDEPAPAPKAKRKPPVRREVKFDVNWLADLIKEKTGKEYKGLPLRTLLRKMVADGEFEHEAKQRYEFSGPNDPIVKTVLKRVNAGDIEKAQKASFDKLKEKAPAKKGRKAKAAPVDDEYEDDDDVEDLD